MALYIIMTFNRGETLTFTQRCMAPFRSVAYSFALWLSMTSLCISIIAFVIQILSFCILSKIFHFTVADLWCLTCHFCEPSNAHNRCFCLLLHFIHLKQVLTNQVPEWIIINPLVVEHWLLYHRIVVAFHSSFHLLHSEYMLAHREPYCFCSQTEEPDRRMHVSCYPSLEHVHQQ